MRRRTSRAALVAASLAFGPSVIAHAGAAAPPPAPPAAAPAAPANKSEEGGAELVRGNAGQAIAAYTEALKDTGLANDRRAAVLNDRAVAYVRIGQPKLALEDYNRAVQLFAEYPAAYNNRGNLLLVLGQNAEALKDFDRAVLLAPGYAAAYSNRANAKVKLGQLDGAIGDFTKAIELLPASAPPLSGRGLAHLATGKPHAAIRDFSRAVNADARFASAYRNRGEARLTVGQNDEAIEDFSRAIAFDINNVELYVVRGYAYLAANNAASAIKDFSRAIELDQKSVAAYQGRGLANGLADAFEDAYGDLNRATELDPRSATAFAYRAFVYKQNGQVDIGLKDIETALKLNPNSAEALWARAELAESRGQTDSAVQDLRKVLSMKPGWRLAADALKRMGASNDTGDDREVEGLGINAWRVVTRGDAYFAVSADYPELRIPLEMMGTGKPKLLEWDLKKPPHKGYGVLRFSGGQVVAKSGPEDTELAAIIDIENAKVLAIQPHRQGQRVASWTWDNDRVQVASIDGVTDEFVLRTTPVTAVAVPAPEGAQPARRPQGSSQKSAGWAPWDEQLGMSAQPQRSAPRPQRRASQQKPKTLFDLLFNN